VSDRMQRGGRDCLRSKSLRESRRRRRRRHGYGEGTDVSRGGHVMSAMEASAYEWKDLDWRAIERQTFKLQKRIYRASSRGDVRAVHKLQRLLMCAGWLGHPLQ